MADGPDPNRWQEPEPQAHEGGGLGDIKSSRLSVPSWLSLVFVLVLLAFILGIWLF